MSEKKKKPGTEFPKHFSEEQKKFYEEKYQEYVKRTRDEFKSLNKRPLSRLMINRYSFAANYDFIKKYYKLDEKGTIRKMTYNTLRAADVMAEKEAKALKEAATKFKLYEDWGSPDVTEIRKNKKYQKRLYAYMKSHSDSFFGYDSVNAWWTDNIIGSD